MPNCGRPALGVGPGNYLDSKAILQGLKKAGEIEALRTHDLRRTFATVAEEVASYSVVKCLLNHRNSREVTGRYTKVDDARLLEEMTRIEKVMLGAEPVALGGFDIGAEGKKSKEETRWASSFSLA